MVHSVLGIRVETGKAVYEKAIFDFSLKELVLVDAARSQERFEGSSLVLTMAEEQQAKWVVRFTISNVGSNLICFFSREIFGDFLRFFKRIGAHMEIGESLDMHLGLTTSQLSPPGPVRDSFDTPASSLRHVHTISPRLAHYEFAKEKRTSFGPNYFDTPIIGAIKNFNRTPTGASEFPRKTLGSKEFEDLNFNDVSPVQGRPDAERRGELPSSSKTAIGGFKIDPNQPGSGKAGPLLPPLGDLSDVKPGLDRDSTDRREIDGLRDPFTPSKARQRKQCQLPDFEERIFSFKLSEPLNARPPSETELRLPEAEFLQRHEELANPFLLLLHAVEQKWYNRPLKWIGKLLERKKVSYSGTALSKMQLFFSWLSAFYSEPDPFKNGVYVRRGFDYTKMLSVAVSIRTRTTPFVFELMKKNSETVLVRQDFVRTEITRLPFPDAQFKEITEERWTAFRDNFRTEMQATLTRHFEKTRMSQLDKEFSNISEFQGSVLCLRDTKSFAEDAFHFLRTALAYNLSLDLYSEMIVTIFKTFKEVASAVYTSMKKQMLGQGDFKLTKNVLFFLKFFSKNIEEIRALFICFFTTCLNLKNFYRAPRVDEAYFAAEQGRLLVLLDKKVASQLADADQLDLDHQIHGFVSVLTQRRFARLLEVKNQIDAMLESLSEP